MVLIGLIIIIAVLIVLAVPRIWRMLSAGTASRRPDLGAPGYRGGDIVSAFRSRDVEAADELALAWLDDDGAPPPVTWPQAGDSHDRDAIRRGRFGQVAASPAQAPAIASGEVAEQAPALLGAGERPQTPPARRQAAGGTTAHRTSSREKKTSCTNQRHHTTAPLAPCHPISERLREPNPDRPHPAGRHRECSFRDPGRAASPASQLRPRAQPARRGRRRLMATFAERACRAARSHRGAGLPARRPGAAAVGPPRRLGRHPAPAHCRCGPSHRGRLVHYHSRHTVSVTTAGKGTIELLVVSPGTAEGTAQTAMNMTATGPAGAQAAAILTASEAQGRLSA
jgi:hypothetical protein